MSIVIIVGKPGVGKTCFATNIMANLMMNSNDDYWHLKRELKALRAGGFPNLEMPPQRHICFADFAVKVNRRLQSYYIDGFTIGLPNPYFETALIPPYSTIFLDEAQRYYDSRNSRAMRAEVYNWFQLHRQNNYNVYLICQRLANIDINIRSLAEKVIVIDELSMQADGYGIMSRFKWHTTEFDSVDTAEEYCLKKDRKEFSILGKKVEVKSYLPLFTMYNSHGNKPIFFNGKENESFDYFQENSYNLSVESFIEYNDNHLFLAPKGYWKNATYDKKIEETI